MTLATGLRTAGALTVSVLLATGCGLIQHSAALTFQVGNVECSPAKAANALGQVCSFLAFYGNISKHSIQVEPASTTVLDKTGKTFSPTADTKSAATFLLKPGQQQQVSWSVTLPGNTRPTKVQWHGSAVDVQFQVPGLIGPSASAEASVAASAQPTSAAPSTPAPVPSTTPAPTSAASTPAVAPTTTTKAPAKPTKTKASAKPTKTTVAPTTTPPHTTAPPTTPPATHIRHTTPPVQHTVAPTTTPAGNSTNPGGGIGTIG